MAAPRRGFPRAPQEPGGLPTPMAEPPARLLVALRRRSAVSEAVRKALPDVPWIYSEGSDPPDQRSVEAILVGSVERELGELDARAFPALRFVQCLYTGVDTFPFERFPDPIAIAGNVGGYAPFVSEHAVALALAAARQLVSATVQVREGRLRPPPDQRPLFRRTAVILGFGEIGKAIARRLRPFETRVLGVNRTGKPTPGCETMYPAHELRTALRQGEFVFECRPLTQSTRGSIGARELDSMPPTAVFVNVGRAGTVDEGALYHHLEDHPEFRVGWDVWWKEDFDAGTIVARFPFAKLPNVVATPHSAGFGPGVEPYVLERALANLARYFDRRRPRHIVDRREYLA